MRSIALQTAARALQPLILFFSIFLLVIGHDTPGGGFVGGLAAASAFLLHALAYGTRSARRALAVDPGVLAAAGLCISASVALAPIVFGYAPFTAAWTELTLGHHEPVALGTPLLFDLGIYLLVLGSALTIVLTLSEE